MKKRSDTLATEPTKSVDTLVLAGARATGDPLAMAYNVPSKAHIKIAGKSMIARVLDAISGSKQTAEMTVIGLQDYADLSADEAWPAVRYVDGANGPAASVYGALDQLGASSAVLVTTCDHALLSPAIIDQFLEDSLSSTADLTVALARRDVIESAFPNVGRTYLRFGDGAYSSCNLFCLVTPEAKAVVKFWQSAEQDRKRPWRIAWRFGIVPALRILIGRPDLESVFAIVSKRLGVRVRPVVLPFAEAAVDVDTPDDLALVEQVLEERVS